MIKFIQLPQDQALGPSDDLWILTDTKSSLFQRINWLLNFQLTEALLHKTPPLPKKIEEILHKCELRSLDFIESTTKSIWLIGSFSYLPCRWLMLAPYSEDQKIEAWWKSIQDRIESLKVTHVRIFATEDLPGEKLAKMNGHLDIRYSLVHIPTTTPENMTAECLKWI